MSGISVKILSENEMQQIHQASLRVLETIGVEIEDKKIATRLVTRGAVESANGNRILLPGGLVTEALELCQREIILESVANRQYPLTPPNRYYSSCCVDPFILDYHAGKRPPKLADCRLNAALVDALDMISMPYKMDLDYADAAGQDALLKSNFIFMSEVAKHYICAPHNIEGAKIWMEMAEIMAGSPLRDKKIVSAMVSPLSPLKLDKSFLELVSFLVPYGIMLIVLPCPMAGATAPYTVAGTIVDFNSENLAAITVIQMLSPGTAVFYHNVGTAFNMKYGLGSLGGPEKILCALAGAEMGHFYGLPSGSAGSATDSVCFDAQNGAETMSQLLLAVSGQADIVTGIGSLGNGMGTSAEQILFDCELIELADYLKRGIVVNEKMLGVASLQRMGTVPDFLTDELTLDLLNSPEHFHAGSFERSGSATSDMHKRLHERVCQLTEQHQSKVPPQKIADLRCYLQEHNVSLDSS
jgi:trimethylamine--corrinoid protein Co-methyltransferase